MCSSFGEFHGRQQSVWTICFDRFQYLRKSHTASPMQKQDTERGLWFPFVKRLIERFQFRNDRRTKYRKSFGVDHGIVCMPVSLDLDRRELSIEASGFLKRPKLNRPLT